MLVEENTDLCQYKRIIICNDMKKKFFYLLTALLASLHGGMAQDVKWAMFGLPYGHAGRFTNGMATIGGTYKDEPRLINRRGEQIGVGCANYDSEEARRLIGARAQKPLVHYDYLCLD